MLRLFALGSTHPRSTPAGAPKELVMRLASKLITALLFGILVALVIDLAVTMLLIEGARTLRVTDELRMIAVERGVLSLLVFGLTAPLMIVATQRLVVHPARQLAHRVRTVAAGNISVVRTLGVGDAVGATARADDLWRNLEALGPREFSDLTREIRLMSEKMEHEAERLAREADAREEALERLRRAETLSTVGRLASNLAHELGTPLNVVSGRAMMIASGEVTGTEAVESARVIVEQANRMTAFIRQMLSHARRPLPKGARAEVQTVLREVASLFSRQARSAGVTIAIDAPTEPVVLDVDELRLVQVLSHLVANAIEASSAGGRVELGVAREAKREGAEAPPLGEGRSSQSFVRIHVRDTGAGISKDDQQTIFKPFYTTKDGTGHAGLGLSIAQGIVREHGGWIDVESELGRGSAFAVCLPEGGMG
ncbi:HAMP domain-containing histidine kinase [Myxococcota bacterium]|nr:HAMP domain-containing histidine kinase [Myxococcota bacterium]